KSKNGAAIQVVAPFLFCELEGVDKIELQPVEIGFDRPDRQARRRSHSRHSRGILQIGVQRTPAPPREVGGGIVAYLPEDIDFVLQNVRRSPLIALIE